MAKPSKKQKKIAVTVSRFGHDPIVVKVSEGAEVSEVLEAAEIELNGRETVYCDGAALDTSDEVENGDLLTIVTPKAAGLN